MQDFYNPIPAFVVYVRRVSIDRKQFVQRNIKTEFSKFEKYKAAIPHGGCVL